MAKSFYTFASMNRIIARVPLKEIAVIGFWRSGASYAEITEITGLTVHEIEFIIQDYADKHNLQLAVTETGRLIWK